MRQESSLWMSSITDEPRRHQAIRRCDLGRHGARDYRGLAAGNRRARDDHLDRHSHLGNEDRTGLAEEIHKQGVAMGQETEWAEGSGFHLFHDDGERHRRCYWRRVAIVLAIAIGLVLFPFLVQAQAIPIYVVERDGLSLRFLSSPCTDASSLILISGAPPQFRQGWRAISSDWRMRDGSTRLFDGCWLEIKKEQLGTEDDVILLVFSDGMTGEVLKKDLLRNPGPGA